MNSNQHISQIRQFSTILLLQNPYDPLNNVIFFFSNLSRQKDTIISAYTQYRKWSKLPVNNIKLQKLTFRRDKNDTRKRCYNLLPPPSCVGACILEHGAGRNGGGNGSFNLREAIRGSSYVSTSLLQFKSHPRIILCWELLYRVEPCIKPFVERGH